jgi:cation-transporting P-type ATPase 13A2
VCSLNGQLIGDPLDIQMYEFVQKLIPLEMITKNEFKINSKKTFEVVKRYEFESKLQRMSVVVKDGVQDELVAIVKGSPEKVRDLCVEESLPHNFK